MLRSKSTTNLSELKNFFTNQSAINSIFRALNLLKLDTTRFGFTKAKNEKISSKNKLFLLILCQFFDVKNPYNYCKSNLYNMFSCGKDMFYRLMKRPEIKWRCLVQNLTKQLISNIKKSEGTTKKGHPKCLILDDTDIPKRGKKIELIGKVFSHVLKKQILGFKGLFLSYFDGTSFFSWEMSLKGEKGGNKEKPQGITREQAKKRYSKKRGKKKTVSKKKQEEREAKKRSKRTEIKKRKEEFFLSKIKDGIDKIKRALKDLSVEYVLCDSWFTCHELVNSVINHKTAKAHFLGMIKMGNTNYTFEGETKNSSQLLEKLKEKKKVKYSRKKKIHHCSCEVDFQGIKVKLFFMRESKNQAWKGLMTTNTELSFEQVYEIYALRWLTEVFFKDVKQYLGFGKCQSVDFDSQIASISIAMLQYNLLSFSKRLTDYQTIGGLFSECQKDSLELTLAERLAIIFSELLSSLTKIFQISTEDLIRKLIAEDKQVLTRLVELYELDKKLKIAS